MANQSQKTELIPSRTIQHAIVPLMRKELNIRNEFSRDFEGSPVSGAVKVPVSYDPTIAEYDVSTGADLTQSATTYLNVPVDNHFAINEIIDGYEAMHTDNLKAQRLKQEHTH